MGDQANFVASGTASLQAVQASLCGQRKFVRSCANQHDLISFKSFSLSFFFVESMQSMKRLLEEACLAESWQEFCAYKTEHQHLSEKEAAKLRDFMDREAWLPLCNAWRAGTFPGTLPVKHVVNKEGTRKKRIVYSFSGDEGIFLKYIAWQLFRFDDWFCPNCYAFRRSVGVKDAILRIRRDQQIGGQYCLKVDVSDYFNSIDVEILLEKLLFVRERDRDVYELFARILRENRVMEDRHIVTEAHGAMAGTPISPFLANVYLRDVDYYFQEKGVTYFRYSDDILLFADSREELEQYREELTDQLWALRLKLNPEKVKISAPGEDWDFLGFGYRDGRIDLSENTIRKTKARIRRKAEALRRWQRKKGLEPEKAAVGLIHAMNRKFYGSPDESGEFTWSRWFFPCLTTDAGLKEIDSYFQEYIRYTVTGRHYKGNFRIRYETMQEWGYESLVHAYYREKTV